MKDSLNRREFLHHSALGLGAPSTLAVMGSLGALGTASAEDKEAIMPKQTRQPNILFVFPDQLRGDWTQANADLPLRTPHLKQLMAEGTTFNDALCPSPLCAPCRASLAQGLSYERCAVPHNDANMPDTATTIYQALRESGYQTASVGKLDLRKQAMSWGFDGRHMVDGNSIFASWGFTHGMDSCGKHDGQNAWRRGRPEPYWNYLKQRGLAEIHHADYQQRPYSDAYRYTAPTPLPDDAYVDNWIGAQAEDLLRQFDRDHPWFMQVNFNGPHEPMDVTEDMAQAWHDVDFPPPHRMADLDATTHLLIRRRYAAMIENIDRWLGRLRQQISQRGEERNTLIIFSSDHGDMLGDHGLWMKKLPWKASVHVPLVIAGPHVRANAQISAPTDLLDVSATILDWAGLAIPHHFDSRSLRPVLTGHTDRVREVVISGLGPWRLLRHEQQALIIGWDHRRRQPPGSDENAFDPTGQALLFDHRHDPWEDHDLAAEQTATVERLRVQLVEHLAG